MDVSNKTYIKESIVAILDYLLHNVERKCKKCEDVDIWAVKRVDRIK